jgi:thiamine-phosphate pyrophosphorylase
MIDANGNRACEGLRVVEDICRFVLESKTFSQKFKQLRHQVTRVLTQLDNGQGVLLNSRDSISDIGADRKAQFGEPKKSYLDLVRANCRRAGEAIRTLEEITQLIDKSVSGQFASFRYDLYTFEKEIVKEFPKEKWKKVDLYVVTDTDLSLGRRTEDIVRQAILGGAQAIQLRDPFMNIPQKMELGWKLRKMTKDHGVLFIVNDRPDIALALNANGVHLGQDDFPVKEARKLLGYDIIIGKSTHNLKQALNAENECPDYISVGPVYSTKSKTDALAPVGIGLLKQIRQKTSLPIVAIGGINRSTIKEVISAGADTVAVISAVVSVKNVKEETIKIVRTIRSVKKNTSSERRTV